MDKFPVPKISHKKEAPEDAGYSKYPKPIVD